MSRLHITLVVLSRGVTEIKLGLPFDCEMWFSDCSCIHSVLFKVTMACHVYMKEGWLENMIES